MSTQDSRSTISIPKDALRTLKGGPIKTSQKIVVISGASSGIGFSAAEQLGKMGALVFAGARKEDDLARLSALENVHGVRLDITHPEDIASLTQHIESSPGYVDVLINNAGVIGWGAIMDRDIDYFREVMEVNLFGHVQMVKAFYPLLRRSTSSPIIINVSSQAGNYAMPFWAPYHMSKWALEAFSDCLRRELLPLGIRVAVVQAGAIESAAFEKQRGDFARYKNGPPSEFKSRATAFLQAAFESHSSKTKGTELVNQDLLHAIYNPVHKLYYQPGRRLLPDLLAAKLPQTLVDRLLMRFGATKA